MLKRLLLLAFLVLSAPLQAQQAEVEAALAGAPKGTRFGLLVVDESGREVVAITPDQRFIPASNTKLFTTAAAYAMLPGIDQPDEKGGTEVHLRPAKRKGEPDVWLVGKGDARMSSAPGCTVDCLAMLADAIAARTKRVRNVVGDDSLWPDQRWSLGMSWNNIGTESGTAVSALNLDDNELPVVVKPAAPGQPPVVTLPYFTLRNEAVTIAAGGKITLALERSVNNMEVRLYGEIPADSKGWSKQIGLDDPAHYAAWSLAQMLKARGVQVSGSVRGHHRPTGLLDDPTWRPGVTRPPRQDPEPLARLIPAPVSEDIVAINKDSQNLHADALLRRLGGLAGTGSRQWGVAALGTLLSSAAVPRPGYDFADGSGMSSYNRVSPRAAVALLRWAASQPWGEAWYASLPVAGVDGTLKRRLSGTPLAGNLGAKTGSLNASHALSGRFRARSGRVLTFAFFANDVPDGTSAVAAMEAALIALYEAS